jgi:hypothetical protein
MDPRPRRYLGFLAFLLVTGGSIIGIYTYLAQGRLTMYRAC